MKAERESLDYSNADRPKVQRWEVRFAMFGGGIAWTLHLLGVYAIAEFGCVRGLGDVIWQGASVVAWLLLAATVLTGGLAAAASWMAWHTERLTRGTNEKNAPVEPETKAFVAGLSLKLNAFFAVFIAAQGVPIFFFLRDCG